MIASPHTVEYIGGPMDGLREIKASAVVLPVLTDCYSHVYVRTPEEPQRAVHQGTLSQYNTPRKEKP